MIDILFRKFIVTDSSLNRRVIRNRIVSVNKTVAGNRMVVENKTITAYKTVVINVASFLHSNTEEK